MKMVNSTRLAGRTRLFTGGSLFLALATAMMPTMAKAQEAEVSREADSEDIVVTGTLLRGAAPVGAAPIVLGEARIRKLARRVQTSCLHRFLRFPTTSTRFLCAILALQ